MEHMTIREELRKLGPDAVRAGMVAFEHRGDSSYERGVPCPTWGRGELPCCFLRHAGNVGELRRAFGQTAIETNFENWVDDAPRWEGGREALRQECIAFLAEHGSAIESRPVQLETVTR